jgi:hypothetical protein
VHQLSGHLVSIDEDQNVLRLCLFWRTFCAGHRGSKETHCKQKKKKTGPANSHGFLRLIKPAVGRTGRGASAEENRTEAFGKTAWPLGPESIISLEGPKGRSG